MISIDAFTHDHPPPSMMCKGSITLDQLVDELTDKMRFCFPFIYGRAIEIVVEAGRCVATALKTGIQDLKLTHFPAIKFRDETHRKKASWEW